MDYEEAKKILIEEMIKKAKTKSKFYFSELAAMLKLKMREAKPLINRMVEEGLLEFWSSGSTSMYGLSGKGKQQ